MGGSGFFCIVPLWKDKVGTRKDVYPLILKFSSYTGWAGVSGRGGNQQALCVYKTFVNCVHHHSLLIL